MYRKTLFLIALLGAVNGPAWAVNKCTGADGSVVYQDAACSNASKTSQKVKTWGEEVYVPKSSPGLKAVTPNLKLEGPPAAAQLLALYRRWADGERLAQSTPRIALGGPAGNLQALQREVEALKVPACMDGPHKTLTALITKSTDAILQFLGKEEATNLIYQVVDRQKLVPEFERGITNASCT